MFFSGCTGSCQEFAKLERLRRMVSPMLRGDEGLSCALPKQAGGLSSCLGSLPQGSKYVSYTYFTLVPKVCKLNNTYLGCLDPQGYLVLVNNSEPFYSWWLENRGARAVLAGPKGESQRCQAA